LVVSFFLCTFAPQNEGMSAMNIQELLNRTDRFAANAGCRITEVDEQHAVAEMKVTNVHLNGGNVCQGGALFTLADLAIAALMNCRGQLTFGISNSIMFVSSAKEGDMLRAEAVNVADHPKIPSVEVRVTNQEGRLICHVTGMGYRKAVSVPQ
jgi:acyl-CoA thioesterase